MKTGLQNSLAGKVTSWSIIGLVLAGTLLISGIADISDEGGIMVKVFWFFLGAVIVVQVIPCLMLFGAMCKGVYSLFGKKAKVTVAEDKK